MLSKTPTHLPPLNAIMMFKTVWALSIVEDNGKLRHASHYAVCLIGGNHPIWGVWTSRGVFLRFYGSRSDIAADYADLAWKAKMATWSLTDARDLAIAERREALEKRYHKKLPEVVS